MKKFAKELVTNRFGIVTATLNICYFLLIKFSHDFFSDIHENIPLLLAGNIFYWLDAYSSKIMLYINSPAILISLCSTFSLVTDSKIPKIIEVKLFFGFFLFFIVLQWLFIGWT